MEVLLEHVQKLSIERKSLAWFPPVDFAGLLRRNTFGNVTWNSSLMVKATHSCLGRQFNKTLKYLWQQLINVSFDHIVIWGKKESAESPRHPTTLSAHVPVEQADAKDPYLRPIRQETRELLAAMHVPSTQEGMALVVPATWPGKQEHLTVWDLSSILFLLQQRWAAITSHVPAFTCTVENQRRGCHYLDSDRNNQWSARA